MARTKREPRYKGQISAVVEQETFDALVAGAASGDRTIAAEVRRVLREYYKSN